MTIKLEQIDVQSIEYDTSNPRVTKLLEMYPHPDADQVFFALSTDSTVGDSDVPSYDRLKQSIQTSGGIINPIVLNRKGDGRFLCIEGNSRVAIYRTFVEESVPGSWDHIPALVHDDLKPAEIHKIRLQAHLVGPRPWEAYAKARYLASLRDDQDMPFSQIVDFCGGREREIQELIDAYHDFKTYYEPVAADNFDVTRFSGFVEVQKPGRKQAISNAGFSLSDFANWIVEKKLYPLNTVRNLARILNHKKARKVFLRHGARRAMREFDRPEVTDSLKEATLEQLAQAITERIQQLPFQEFLDLQQKPDKEPLFSLIDALDAIIGLREQIEQGD